MLVPQSEGSGTPTESHHTPTSEASQHELPSLLVPPVPTESLPTVIPSDIPPLRKYTRRPRITQSSVLPPVADEPASLLRDDSQGEACPTDYGFKANQDRANIAKTSPCLELEINGLKARIKLLEDKDRGFVYQSGDDTPIKGRRLDEREEAAERVSDDTEEMATVLTSMDAASILTSGGVQVVPTTTSTPYTRRKEKEKMVESDTPKKKKLQEQIDVQVARELEEQLAREDQRMSEQIARDAEVAKIHAEEELQMLINCLDMSNETVVKYLREYAQILEDLSIKERIELISDLVKYQENYAQVLKYQTMQRKPRSKTQKKDYYMAVIKGHAGWKTKDFKGMSFEQLEAKFNTVWKQIEDFIPMGSKEEAERLKRKGLRLEQESAKKLKILEEVHEEVKSSEEVPEEKVKAMMQLVPVEELWGLVKETISIRPATNDKEKELWVKLKIMFEPDVEDYLWTHTQNLLHAPIEWKLYDTCGVHHVSTKDQDIFMLIEKISSEEGSGDSYDMLQTLSGELLLDGK
nr:hypothetical protein [Tanacetum cinerariifolium]